MAEIPEIEIRFAERGDAAAVAALANKLNVLHDKPESFSAERILEDGFEREPGFSVLLAEVEGRAVGYALYHPIYNSDLPGWGLWLVDLFVEAELRSHGIGRRLLARVAAEAVATGAVSVWWGVLSSNRKARDFYAAIGVRDEDARILELDGPALTALAAEATAGG